MKKFKSYVRMIGLYFRTNISSVLEYRFSFLVSAMGSLLSNIVFIFFWRVAFNQVGGTIGGYDFRDMMFILAVAATANSWTWIFCSGRFTLQNKIVTGELDTYLLQPKNPLISELCSGTSLVAWGDLAYGIILMFISGQGVLGWVYYVVATVCGGILITCVSVLTQSVAFFAGDANWTWIVDQCVNTFSQYPEGIFAWGLRILFYTIIPVGFIVFVPLRLARGGPLWLLPVLLAVTGLFCLVAWRVFSWGLKKYESGNLVVTRL